MARSEEILNLVIGPDVLDVGCSDHQFRSNSQYWLHGVLRKRFPTLVGIDLNEEIVRMMRENGDENVFVGSAETYQLERKFDTIVAGELIEHLSNPGLFLENCRNHLKPKGRLVLSTPYAFSLLYILYSFLKFPKTCQNDEHVMWFCPRTLIELASRCGFVVSSWELIEDYELENPSFAYGIFARAMVSLGRIFLPGRLRKNDMLFVLVREGSKTEL
jgi:SAM-dependent methyltransferase